MSTLAKLMSDAELREHLRLGAKEKTRTWQRLRPFFAPAMIAIPLVNGGSQRGLRLYDAAKVQELLDARRHTNTGLSKSRALKRVG